MPDRFADVPDKELRVGAYTVRLLLKELPRSLLLCEVWQRSDIFNLLKGGAKGGKIKNKKEPSTVSSAGRKLGEVSR